MKRTLAAMVLATLVLQSTRADTITFDLGPDSRTIEALAIPLDSVLAGVPLDGRTISIDINFANGEYLIPVVHDQFFGSLAIFSSALSPGVLSNPVGKMIDVNGQQMPNTFLVTALFFAGNGFVINFGQLAADTYGMHLECTLPDDPGVTIASAVANIGGSSSFDDHFHIAPYNPVNLPDATSTCGLLLSSVCGLVALRRKC